jgi:20S proteasome subunit beta 4
MAQIEGVIGAHARGPAARLARRSLADQMPSFPRPRDPRALLPRRAGLVGKDFTMIMTDSNCAASILIRRHDYDKILHLDNYKLLGMGGDPADMVQFGEYIQKNLALYELRNGFPLSTRASANYLRGEVAHGLRAGGMVQLDFLLGGYDKDVGPSLYFLDYLSALHKVNKVAHGYPAMFVTPILDREWHAEMTEAEALEVMEHCIKAIRERFLVSMPSFTIKLVNKDGVKVVRAAGQ